MAARRGPCSEAPPRPPSEQKLGDKGRAPRQHKALLPCSPSLQRRRDLNYQKRAGSTAARPGRPTETALRPTARIIPLDMADAAPESVAAVVPAVGTEEPGQDLLAEFYAAAQERATESDKP